MFKNGPVNDAHQSILLIKSVSHDVMFTIEVILENRNLLLNYYYWFILIVLNHHCLIISA